MKKKILILSCLSTILLAGSTSAGEVPFHAETNQAVRRAQENLFVTGPGAGMEFVPVKGGCFQMGSNSGGNDEKPVHAVCVDDFLLGRHEVTQGQWKEIMGTNPSEFKRGDSYPVEQVSWEDVQNYIGKLNAKTGKRFRLPTEAEWEYACRSGGKNEKYCGGDNNIDSLAWNDVNSGGTTHPVGTRKPNGLGIHDMSGNVYEWCSDWYGSAYYGISPRNNPQGPASGSGRVRRGGSWIEQARAIRSTYRCNYSPTNRYKDLGFRLVLFPDR